MFDRHGIGRTCRLCFPALRRDGMHHNQCKRHIDTHMTINHVQLVTLSFIRAFDFAPLDSNASFHGCIPRSFLPAGNLLPIPSSRFGFDRPFLRPPTSGRVRPGSGLPSAAPVLTPGVRAQWHGIWPFHRYCGIRLALERSRGGNGALEQPAKPP